MGLYQLYQEKFFPHIFGLPMIFLAPYRKPALARASGNVIEIGFGTGLNLPAYPAGVTALTGVDPMKATPPGLRRRLARARFPVHRHQAPIEAPLPFAPETFDCAVVTWSLCTVPDPVAGLREVRRVLRPGAPLFFAEHGRSDDPRVVRWQERLNGIWQVLGCGCQLDRAADEIIEAGGFRIETLRRFDIPRVPRTHGHLYLGNAVAPR